MFGPALADELRAHDFAFDLQVQLCADLDKWRVTAEHRPLGEIMQVRRIYSASAKVRRLLNSQPQREPTSADEVLPWPELDGQPERTASSNRCRPPANRLAGQT